MTRLMTIALLLVYAICPVSTLIAGAPYCLSCREETESFSVVWYYEGVNVASYINDHGEVEYHFLVCHEDRDNRAAAQFAGIRPDCPLQSVSLFIWGVDHFPQFPGGPTSPIALSLFERLPAFPDAAPLWGEDTVSFAPVPSSGDWFEYPLGLFVPQVDTLYVQAHWLSETPTAPLLAVDHTVGGVTHSYYGYQDAGQIIWTPDYGADLLIRLNYNIPDTLVGYRNPGCMPDSFALFLDPDSIGALSKGEVFMSVPDSLHVTLDRKNTGGNFLAVAAWNEGVPDERCTPLLLSARPPAPFPLQLDPDSLLVQSGVGELVEHEITVTNPQAESFGYLIDWPRQDAVWLAVQPDSGAIPPLVELSLRVTVDNRAAEPGCHYAEIRIYCTGASYTYEAGSLRVLNAVDAATAVENSGHRLPAACGLGQNFPNPFNTSTCIHSTTEAAVHIYNLAGQLVRILFSSGGRALPPYLFFWDGTDHAGNRVSSGIYFYTQYQSGVARKMLLLK